MPSTDGRSYQTKISIGYEDIEQKRGAHVDVCTVRRGGRARQFPIPSNQLPFQPGKGSFYFVRVPFEWSKQPKPEGSQASEPTAIRRTSDGASELVSRRFATMITPAASTIGGAVHVVGMTAVTRLAMPFASPKDKKYESQPGEKLIQLPARPPDVTMASWAASALAREIPKVLATSIPENTVSAALGVSPWSLYAAGMALWAGSFGLVVKTIIDMKRHNTPVAHGAGTAQTICKSGVFGMFRHPIYIGMMGSCVAMPLLLDSMYSFVGLAITAAYLVGHVMPVEEKWMLAKFGSEYAEYCKKVKRFFLF